jgi:hypothetical protein
MTGLHSRTIVASWRVLAVAVALEISAGGAWAGPGSIAGTVRNPDGSGRKSVVVTAVGGNDDCTAPAVPQPCCTGAGTGTCRETRWARTTSGAGGVYSLAGLEYGTYRVFFDPAPRNNHLAFRWNGGAEKFAAAPALVVRRRRRRSNVDATPARTHGDGLPTPSSPPCDPPWPVRESRRRPDDDGV